MIYTQLGSEKKTVTSGAAVGFASIPSATTVGVTYYAQVTVETASVRYNCFNTPTQAGAEGSPIAYAGETFEVWGGNDIRKFLAIAATATSGVLNVLYFGTPV